MDKYYKNKYLQLKRDYLKMIGGAEEIYCGKYSQNILCNYKKRKELGKRKFVKCLKSDVEEGKNLSGLIFFENDKIKKEEDFSEFTYEKSEELSVFDKYKFDKKVNPPNSGPYYHCPSEKEYEENKYKYKIGEGEEKKYYRWKKINKALKPKPFFYKIPIEKDTEQSIPQSKGDYYEVDNTEVIDDEEYYKMKSGPKELIIRNNLWSLIKYRSLPYFKLPEISKEANENFKNKYQNNMEMKDKIENINKLPKLYSELQKFIANKLKEYGIDNTNYNNYILNHKIMLKDRIKKYNTNYKTLESKGFIDYLYKSFNIFDPRNIYRTILYDLFNDRLKPYNTFQNEGQFKHIEIIKCVPNYETKALKNCRELSENILYPKNTYLSHDVYEKIVNNEIYNYINKKQHDAQKMENQIKFTLKLVNNMEDIYEDILESIKKLYEDEKKNKIDTIKNLGKDVRKFFLIQIYIHHFTNYFKTKYVGENHEKILNYLKTNKFIDLIKSDINDVENTNNIEEIEEVIQKYKRLKKTVVNPSYQSINRLKNNIIEANK